MLVKEVRKITDKKRRIVLDDGFSFVLYASEVRRLGIREGEDISRETVRSVLDDILRKRSRLRCMNLLKTCDRTEGQLRDRLRMDGYPDEIIDQAIEYVASYRYIDDARYAENYIRQMSSRKSMKQIEYDLMKKGVDRETVRAAFSAEDIQKEDFERTAILRLAVKKGYDADDLTEEDRMKLTRYLLGKGFGYSSVRDALSSS